MGSKKILTIEIGEKNIRVCEVGYGRPVVYRTVSFLTPEGTTHDGYIVSVDKLADYIKRKLKAARLIRKEAVFTISSSRIMSRETEIPYVKENLVRRVALARADECFPMNLEDYIISSLLLTKDKKQNKMRVNLFASPRDLITGYFNLASKIGIKVESIDYVGNAIHQWLNRRLKKETALVVDVGYSISIASVMEEGRMRLQRNISTGVDRFLISEEENKENSQLGDEDYVSPFASLVPQEEEIPSWAVKPWELNEEDTTSEVYEAYEEIIEEAKLRGEDISEILPVPKVDEDNLNSSDELAEDIGENPIDSEEIADAKLEETEIELLKTSLLSLIEYYNNHKMGKPITTVYITGEGSYILNLESILQESLGIPTVLMRQAFCTMLGRTKPSVHRGNVESFYISCMGAGLSPVGMVPYEIMEEKERKEDTRRYRKILTGVLIFCLLVFALCRINYVEARRQNNLIKSEIQGRLYAAEIHDKYIKNRSKYDYLIEIDRATRRHNENLLQLFTALEESIPKGAQINTMASDNEVLSLNVLAVDKKTAAKFIMQIRKLQYVSDIEVSEITYDETSGLYSLDMNCKYENLKDSGKEESEDE